MSGYERESKRPRLASSLRKAPSNASLSSAFAQQTQTGTSRKASSLLAKHLEQSNSASNDPDAPEIIQEKVEAIQSDSVSSSDAPPTISDPLPTAPISRTNALSANANDRVPRSSWFGTWRPSDVPTISNAASTDAQSQIKEPLVPPSEEMPTPPGPPTSSMGEAVASAAIAPSPSWYGYLFTPKETSETSAAATPSITVENVNKESPEADVVQDAAATSAAKSDSEKTQWSLWPFTQPATPVAKASSPDMDIKVDASATAPPNREEPSTTKQSWFGWSATSPAMAMAQSPNIGGSNLEPGLGISTPTVKVQQEPNPVVQAVPAGTWRSYFSAKNTALPAKALAQEQANEPEAMEIDLPPADQEKPPPSPVPRKTPSTFFNPSFTRAKNVQPPRTPSPVPSTSKEPPKAQVAEPLTITKTRQHAPKSPSIRSLAPPSNIILPSFDDTFKRKPRADLPTSSKPYSQRVSSFIWQSLEVQSTASIDPFVSRKGKEKMQEYEDLLPRALGVVGQSRSARLKKIRQVVVIGIHGWFPGQLMRSLFGQPTGTSSKFAKLQTAAVEQLFLQEGLSCPEIMTISLEGEGCVEERVEKLYKKMCVRDDWLETIGQADLVLVATHSQGSIVSTMLLHKLLLEGLCTGERCGLLCLAAISQGPFVSLNNSYLLQPYFSYIENAAAKELFEFQDPASPLSVKYRQSLSALLSSRVKVHLVGSLNDQVVPLSSALCTTCDHPYLLRSVFIDGAAFQASDFICNLIAFCVQLRNSGLSDHGLMVHLSDSLAGSLGGVGHSTIYNELSIYRQFLSYVTETTSPAILASSPEPFFDTAFQPRSTLNPYELPWILRSIIADKQVQDLLSGPLSELQTQFTNWHPVSKPLKDVKFRLHAFSKTAVPAVPVQSTPKL